jgi:hypothetical protein
MSQDITNSLKGPIDKAFELLSQFIEVCPDGIWKEKAGGWPIWQQVYHSVGAVDFFLGTTGQSLVPGPVAGLKEIGTEALSKDQVRGALREARTKVDQFVAALADQDLPKRNEPLFANFKYDLTLAATLTGICSHALYHLGSCDAALRNNGLKGVF